MTVIVALLAKPEIPSSGVTNFKRIKITATDKAVKSADNYSNMNANKAIIITLMVNKIDIYLLFFIKCIKIK